MVWDWFRYSIKNKKRWWNETFPGRCFQPPECPFRPHRDTSPAQGMLWGGQGSSGGRGEARASSRVGHVGHAGPTPALVTLPAHYPSLLSILLHKKERDGQEMLSKATERAVRGTWRNFEDELMAHCWYNNKSSGHRIKRALRQLGTFIKARLAPDRSESPSPHLWHYSSRYNHSW